MPEAWGVRKRLPNDRKTLVHEVVIGDDVNGTVSVGMYDDGTPGEIFVRIDRMGSTVQGMLNAWAVTFSMALQYGIPLPALVKNLQHMRFEPNGFTGKGEIGFAKSIVDYIVRWLQLRFCPETISGAVASDEKV